MVPWLVWFWVLWQFFGIRKLCRVDHGNFDTMVTIVEARWRF